MKKNAEGKYTSEFNLLDRLWVKIEIDVHGQVASIWVRKYILGIGANEVFIYNGETKGYLSYTLSNSYERKEFTITLNEEELIEMQLEKMNEIVEPELNIAL